MQQDQTTQPADAAAVPAEATTAAASMPEATSAPADAAGDAVIAGDTSNAAALQQMGFDHLIQNFDWVGWVVFVTLMLMSVVSWIYTVMNMIRNTSITGKMEKVIRTFWETPSAADAVRFMEEQPKSSRSRRSRSTAQRPRPITNVTKAASGGSPEPFGVHRPRPAPGRGARELEARRTA
jgi:hypothetical protein